VEKRKNFKGGSIMEFKELLTYLFMLVGVGFIIFVSFKYYRGKDNIMTEEEKKRKDEELNFVKLILTTVTYISPILKIPYTDQLGKVIGLVIKAINIMMATAIVGSESIEVLKDKAFEEAKLLCEENNITVDPILESVLKEAVAFLLSRFDTSELEAVSVPFWME
jgi:hypothetical protein